MKIKEIVEMSTDELLTKKRDLRQESAGHFQGLDAVVGAARLVPRQ